MIKKSKKFSSKNKPSPELCWGRNSVLSMLEEMPESCREVHISSGADDNFKNKVRSLLLKTGVVLKERDIRDLHEMVKGEKHQGIVAVINLPAKKDLRDMVSGEGSSLIVVLDHLKDPHNLGAIVRSVEVVGGGGVIYPSKRSVALNGTVLKTSAGAAWRVPLCEVTNLVRTLKDLKEKGYWVVGLDHRSSSDIWSSPLPDKMVLVVGSEGEGLSRLVSDSCDELRSIPMAGKTGSLNASVAAAVGMFEWKRLYR